MFHIAAEVSGTSSLHPVQHYTFSSSGASKATQKKKK